MTTVNTQIINDGPRNVVMKFNIVGTAVELADALLVDVSTLSGAPNEVKVMAVDAALEGFGAELIWDATANVRILDIPAGQDFDQCYRRYGGLPNDAGAGKTGDILISTSGAAVGLTGHVIVTMRKRGFVGG